MYNLRSTQRSSYFTFYGQLFITSVGSQPHRKLKAQHSATMPLRSRSAQTVSFCCFVHPYEPFYLMFLILNIRNLLERIKYTIFSIFKNTCLSPVCFFPFLSVNYFTERRNKLHADPLLFKYYNKCSDSWMYFL